MMEKKSVRDIEVRGKKVLVRVDFNVPIDEKTGAIMDDSRIQASLPTIQYLINRDAKVILCSHLGRPEGKPNKKYSLSLVVTRIAGVLGKPVAFTSDCIGSEAESAVSALKEGDVLLLENLRFHAEEEKNDPGFARALAKLADIYVNDAFGTAHRKHASIVGVTKFLPAVAGLLLEKEIRTLGGLLADPEHPFGALLGGAKISDKVGLMINILGKVDLMLIGGGMAATFLKSEGYEIGQSLFEADCIETAQNIMKQAGSNHVRIVLPIDVVITDDVSDNGKCQVVTAENVPRDRKIVDVGPKTVESFKAELEKCRVVFWNGPMGVYEVRQFAGGTEAMVKTLVNLKASTIIGGGSTAEIVTNMGCAGKMTFVSTGGGASMSFLSGETLPGVEALQDK
jgi:phosphoglycerate kinase